MLQTLYNNVGRVLTLQLIEELQQPLFKEVAVELERRVGRAAVSVEEKEEDLGRGYHGALVKLADMLEEIRPLFHVHFAEIEHNTNPLFALDLDLDGMIRRQEAGQLIITGLFKERQLVGYFFARLGRAYSYEAVVAGEEIFFILPEHRVGLLGLRFMKYTFGVLKAAGVYSITSGARAVHNLDALYKRAGFELYSTNYRKVL